MLGKELPLVILLIKRLAVLGLPVALFLVGGSLLMHLTGRDQFPQTSAPESVPLHFRLGGYDGAEVQAYWGWLGPEGQLAERRFLELDLVFPLLYGGAILIALLRFWDWLGRPFAPLWLLAPVAMTLVADWTENLLQWQQLRLLLSEPVQAKWIALASLATTIKMISFALSCLLLLALAARLMVQTIAAAK